MAEYKVPQDVEADDKLIGPFSFRQFVYLIIVVLFGLLGWGLAQLFIPLLVIAMPGIIFFGALALPLRKDQPMEIYLAAIVSFYLKPRRRLWDPDGVDSLIEITAPKTTEVQRSKDLSQTEAERRFSYLAEIVDSQGWAVRGSGVQAPNSAMKSEVYFDAMTATDVLDSDNSTAQAFNDKLDQSDARRHEGLVKMMQNPTDLTPKSAAITETPDTTTGIDGKPLEYNPYPDIQQAVVQPISQTKPVAKQPITTSEKVVPAGIINLASNTDLSIAAIAREANRIQDKQDLSDGAVISLH